MNWFKDLQNAASRGAREMELPLLLNKMSVSKASIATRNITMVSVKELVFLLSAFVSRGSERCLWRHNDHGNKQVKSGQCQLKVSVVIGSQIC